MTHCGIEVDEAGVMLRPGRRSEIVRRRAAEMALPEVKRYTGADCGSDVELMDALMQCINGADGYEIVTSLESFGWCGGSALVEIFNANFIGMAERELVEQWVRCLGVKLEVPIGASVLIKGGRGQGKVVKHFPEAAKYGVRTAEQGPLEYCVLLPEEIEVL